MRPALAAVALVTLALAGCGKSSTTQPQQGGQPAEATMSPEAVAKAQAALPAPYNTADLANGEAKFGLCKSCHTIAAGGANMTGPNLHGFYGKKAGEVPGFKFSDKLLEANLTMDAPTLDRWLEKPQDVVPGSKMTFPGLKDAKDRTDLIAWLIVHSGS